MDSFQSVFEMCMCMCVQLFDYVLPYMCSLICERLYLLA